MQKLEQLRAAAREHAAKAREVAEKAAGESRSMTETERAEYDTAMAKGRELVEQIKVAVADEGVLAEAKALADAIGGGAAADLALQAAGGVADLDTRRKMANLGLQVVNAPEFKSALAGALKGRDFVAQSHHFDSGPIPVKSLFTGGSQTSAGAFVVAEQSGIVEMLGRRPLTLRQLVSVRRTGSDAIEYVRQTAHTNAAAPVPEATSAAPIDGTTVTAVMGGRKPQGSWAFERETTNVKTIAEWVPASKRALADVAALEGLIDDELRRDVAEAEEDQILNGDGTGENLLGVLNTPGTQGQLFDTDLFTTARRAITKARIGGRVNPTAFLFNPEDDETIDLARETGTGAFIGGGPFGTTPNTLWGIPRASSEFIPAGTFVLADWTKVVLWDREQTQVSITDSHEDYFVRNLVAILAEERVALATTRPSAVVIGDARA